MRPDGNLPRDVPRPHHLSKLASARRKLLPPEPLRRLSPRKMTTFTYPAKFPETFVISGIWIGPKSKDAAFADGKGESVLDHFARIPARWWAATTSTSPATTKQPLRSKTSPVAYAGLSSTTASHRLGAHLPQGRRPAQPARPASDYITRLSAGMAGHGIRRPGSRCSTTGTLPQALEERRLDQLRHGRMPSAIYADTITSKASRAVG